LLQEIHVRNLALIDELRLEFDPGFNVLTGETGAGKSIIIDALGLALGERFNAEMVRTGADSLWVEAVFTIDNRLDLRAFLEETGIPMEEATLIIQREVNNSGKNRCRVNGNLVTVLVLQKIGGYLIDIHGQHEHQSLLFSEKQMVLLDQYCGPECLDIRDQLQQLYQKWHQLTVDYQRIQQNQLETARKIDLLRYQTGEIENARLILGEDEELQRERGILAASERLFEAAAQSYQVLYDNNEGRAVVELLGEAEKYLNQATGIDPRLEAVLETLRNISGQTEDISRELRNYQEQVQFDPERLAVIADRLEEITQLKRKYGATIGEILRYAQKCADELNHLENQEEHSHHLEEELKKLRVDLGVLAESLSVRRQDGAERLEKAIVTQLAELNMAKTQFKIALTRNEDEQGIPYQGGNVEITPAGADRIEFLVAPNPGETPKPMSKIASGGELSRIMLALKAILAELDQIPTMVFDEIDVGIGGRTAQAVAEKILGIGQSRQVICVTHLPQIASMAKRHFYIEKRVDAERTHLSVTALMMRERVDELARMLGGAEVTDTTRKHAREMLAMAEKLRLQRVGVVN
jgi:DNA repair protein RecN (Recombination protein N)